MTVKFNDKEIELKFSIRALIMYENVTQQDYTHTNINDTLTLFYCYLVTSAKDYSITWDMFLDFIDEDVTVIQKFNEWLLAIKDVNDKLKKN